MVQKTNKVKKWLLAVGIAIIFTMFISYGITTFYEEPRHEAYCKNEQAVINWTQDECVSHGGQWTVYPVEKYEGDFRYGAPVSVAGVSGYCDPDFTCRKVYEEALMKFQDKAFIIMVIAGFIALVLGILIANGTISAGFLLGGLLTLFIATTSYWARFQNWARFIILGLVLIILVWIAYKKTR
ncbi:hypothetical protein JXB27_02395 [Candidatus Woesearchaeota archaeon]|nr:hypothetical protein [Candidatus Woesearchaeota archaeon]